MTVKSIDPKHLDRARRTLFALGEPGSPAEVRRRLSEASLEDELLVAISRAARESLCRTEVISSPAAVVVLVGWAQGAESPPHEHGGSTCLFRVISGVATEFRYEVGGDGLARIVGEERYLPGAVVTCPGDDIHSMGNDPEAMDVLITLHVYRPRPIITEYPPAAEDKQPPATD